MTTPRQAATGCTYAELDGSYVLGALSPVERLEFEQHLASCADCSRSVRDLAGLPGLLGRVDPAVLHDPPVDEPVPPALLRDLVREVRRTGRRRTVLTGGLAAAAVAAVLALALSGILTPDRTTAASPRQAVPAAREMVPVDGAPVHADLALEPVAWGTRLDLACTYGTSGGSWSGSPQRVTYLLFVRTRDGRAEQVGTWRALEGRTMRLTAATAASRADIASVEVRTTDGRPVLRLTG